MKNDAKKFLNRMLENGGYIANGLYDGNPRFWHSDVKTSSKMMDIVLFHYLRKERLIYQDRTGKYLVSEKGKRFAKPWWKRMME
jgi:hypothetical protein